MAIEGIGYQKDHESREAKIASMKTVRCRPELGAFHQVSCKHLPAYLDEFDFRFNNREKPYIFRDAMRELLTAENIEYKETSRINPMLLPCSSPLSEGLQAPLLTNTCLGLSPRQFVSVPLCVLV